MPDQTSRMCYNRAELLCHAQGQLSTNRRINASLGQALKKLNLCARPPAKRGNRAGTRKKRAIKTVALGRRTTDRHIQPKQTRLMRQNNLVQVPLVKWDLPIVINTNIRGGLAFKLDEIQTISNQHAADVIGITETWCSGGVPAETVHMDGYVCYRRDRQDGRQGGGVVCYVRSSIPTKHWSNLDSQKLETIWLTLRPTRMPRTYSHLIVGVLYHPPNDDDKGMLNQIEKSLDWILRHHPHSAIILLGDFNKLKDNRIRSNYQLRQIVKSPTRGRAILDKVYTNALTLYSKTQVTAPVGLSDHNVVTCYPALSETYCPPSVERIPCRQQSPMDKALFVEALKSVCWDPLYHMPTCEEQFLFFANTLNLLLDTYLPFKEVRRCSNDRPWITDSFRNLVQRRQRALKDGQMTLYRMYRNRVNRARKSLQRQYYQAKVQDLGSQRSKQWWREINTLIGRQQGNNNLQALANTVCDGNTQLLADKICETFQSVTADFRPLTPEDSFIPLNSDCAVPGMFTISVSDVERELMKVHTDKAVGPDSVPNWVIRDCAGILAKPVCAIFNSSLRDGWIPDIWKAADIVPLPKVSPPTKLDTDLRPISLTPVLSKCLEKFISSWIMDTAREQIDIHQYGSMQGSSTVHALVNMIHRWQEALDSPGNLVHILFLDFRKAFDLVDHTVLMTKMSQLGLPHFITRWLTNFLTGRRMRTKLGNVVSDWVGVNAGVPQGTLLGPVCFLIHINDLRTSSAYMVKYVDDSTQWSVNRTTENSHLQDSATEADTWATVNNMSLNSKKPKTWWSLSPVIHLRCLPFCWVELSWSGCTRSSSLAWPSNRRLEMAGAL